MWNDGWRFGEVEGKFGGWEMTGEGGAVRGERQAGDAQTGKDRWNHVYEEHGERANRGLMG